MKKTPIGYREKLKAIKDYTALGINSRKFTAKNPNFTLREKKLITKYYNSIKSGGYFDYDAHEQVFIPKVKFIKSKKKVKGSPKLKGYIVQGAAPTDKVHGNKIIKGNFEKIFIPMDFSDLPADDEANEYEEEIYSIIFDALAPYDHELISGNYFTVVLQNGWELGQRMGKEIPKNERREGQKIGEDLEGDEKLMNLADKIIELLSWAHNKYKMGTMIIVKGIYIWKFINQRKPTNKEKSIINKKRKGRKK